VCIVLQGSHNVHIEYEVEVCQILSPEELKTMTDKTVQQNTPPDTESKTVSFTLYTSLFNAFSLWLLFKKFVVYHTY